MAGQKHPHKYKRHRYKTGTEVYFCTLPNCTHRVECAFTLGKESICNRCGEKFLMDEYSIRLAEPHCQACKVTKVDSNIEVKVSVDTDSILDKVLANAKLSNGKGTSKEEEPKQPLEKLPSLRDRLDAVLSRKDDTEDSDILL